MRAAALAMVIALALAVAAMVYPALRQWWDVDRCVDGGGRWDYQSDSCVAPLR
ncbi:MAG: hypothetical protein IPJ21_07620 [Sterolibacteriaceae bacterium]|nr:hypothetical protein [Sterolibacteriaceae bacterium]MBK7663395.1 hypothetical protein [Sterolibacteriaceae bacterium]MBK9083735.1 hypothetical protein [Sterolibacteriaceae bacterium]